MDRGIIGSDVQCISLYVCTTLNLCFITCATVVDSKKVKANIALPGGNPISELWDVTCHMGSHRTCHLTQVNAPRLTPGIQAGTRFTYPRGMEG